MKTIAAIDSGKSRAWGGSNQLRMTNDELRIGGWARRAVPLRLHSSKLVLKRAAKVYFVGDYTKFDNPAL